MEVTIEIKNIIEKLEKRMCITPTKPLHLAAYNGDDAVIEESCEHANANMEFREVDEFGSIPLWYACVKCRDDCIGTLTDGIDESTPAFKDIPEVPILYALALLGHTKGFVALRNYHVDLPLKSDAEKRIWRAALFVAIMEKKNKIAENLIEDLETYPFDGIQDDGIMNPLIAAITAWNTAIITKLIEIKTPIVIGGFCQGTVDDKTMAEIENAEKMLYGTVLGDSGDDGLEYEDAVGFSTVIDGTKVRVLWPSVYAALRGMINLAKYLAEEEESMLHEEFRLVPASNFNNKQYKRKHNSTRASPAIKRPADEDDTDDSDVSSDVDSDD